VWSIDSNLILLPPLWLGDGAKSKGCGTFDDLDVRLFKLAMMGGTELLRLCGLWSRGDKWTLFLLFFLWLIFESSTSSKLSILRGGGTKSYFSGIYYYLVSSLPLARYFRLRYGIISLLGYYF